MQLFFRTVLLLRLVVASPSSAEEAPSFEQKYDRFKDYTSLNLDLGRVIKGPHHEVELEVSQAYRGEGRNEKIGASRLYFLSNSDDGWIYLDYHPIALLVDGERMRFTPDHDGTVGKGYLLEHMFVRLSEPQFQKLTLANKIEGQVGTDEFKLNPDQVAAIKEFSTLAATSDRPLPSGRFVAPPPPPKPKSPAEIAREQEAQRLEAARRQAEALRRQEAQLKEKLDQKIRLGKVLEKSNTKAAIAYYKEVIDLAPASSQADTAKERIKTLTKN